MLLYSNLFKLFSLFFIVISDNLLVTLYSVFLVSCLLGRASIFSIFFLSVIFHTFFSTFWKVSLPLSSKPFHWLFYFCYHISNIWRLSPFVSDDSLKKMFLFIYLAMIGLSCSMWDLVLWPGIKPEPPALGAWSFSHWTTRDVPDYSLFYKSILGVQFT